MKRFTIPALVVALGTALVAAPQGNGKKASTAPTTSPADTKAPAAKGDTKAKAKGKKSAKPKDTTK